MRDQGLLDVASGVEDVWVTEALFREINWWDLDECCEEGLIIRVDIAGINLGR